MPYEVILSGRVQGVGCRYYCANIGRAMHLGGAATNLPDGTVRVSLSTSDIREAERYAIAARENTFDFNFFGRIVSATVRPSNHPVSGDYEW
jgi:acylphosphatase